jgi:hypothetical protein
MNCPHCKLENPPGAQQCDCGYAFGPSAGETRQCPYCAESVQAAAIKCRYCGASLLVTAKSKIPAIGIAAVVKAAVLALAVIYTGSERPAAGYSPGTDSSDYRTAQPTVVTRADYNRIQTGMSYEQVRSIIGTYGVELSRSDLAGYTTVMYSWKNSNGSNMNAIFQNGQLVNKAQFGLR